MKKAVLLITLFPILLLGQPTPNAESPTTNQTNDQTADLETTTQNSSITASPNPTEDPTPEPTFNINTTPSPNTQQIPTSSVTNNVSTTQNLLLIIPTESAVIIEETPTEPPEKKLEFTYLDDKLGFYPPKPKSRYPDIDVNGFYEGKLAMRDYSPKDISTTDNRWQAIRNDPYYNKLPRDVLVGDFTPKIRYQFQIDGQLDDNLSVHYDIEQEEDFPGKYDIKVNYKRNTLTFHHLDAEFQNGEFIDVKKSLNGAKFESEGDNYSLITAIGQQRSEPKKFEAFGTGRKDVAIGNRSIYRGSVKVWINNHLKHEDSDYTVNYFDGIVNFNTPPQATDYIEIIYEFTNPIADFIPLLNRKNFVGFQYKYHENSTLEKVKLSNSYSETITPSGDMLVDKSPYFYLKKTPVSLGSLVVYVNDDEQEKNIDYFIKHDTGKILFKDKLFFESDVIKANYSYYLTGNITEDIIGKNNPGPYRLSFSPVIPGTVRLTLNDKPLQELKDYNINYDEGTLQFNFKVDYPSIININYGIIQTETKINEAESTPLQWGVTYLNEYANSNDEELQLNVSSESITITGNTFYVNNTPILTDNDITVSLDGSKLDITSFNVTNAYLGEVTLTGNATFSGSADHDIVITYDYQKSFRTNSTFVIGNGGTKVPENVNNSYSTDVNNGSSSTFYLDNIPIKKGGIAYIKFWDVSIGEEYLLEEGKEFTFDYGEDGIDVTLKFLISDNNNDYSFSDLNTSNRPSDGDRITLVYDYTPNSSPDGGSFDQRLFGLTFSKNLTDRWSVATEIAGSDHNFTKPRVENTVTFTGTGSSDSTYSLGKSNVVEDSESIYNNVTGVRLTKDEDYTINYQNGTIRFLNLTPTTKDEFTAEYTYFENETETGIREPMKFATKISTSYKTPNLSLTSSMRKIDEDYLPIGKIQGDKGITAYKSALDWKINSTDNFNMVFDRQKRIATVVNNENIYEIDNDLQATAKVKFFKLFDTTQTGRIFREAQDINPETNLRAVDRQTHSYDLGVGFGPTNFRHNFKRGISQTTNDYKDFVDPTRSQSKSFQYRNDTFFPNLGFFGATSLKPYYETSLSKDKVYSDENEFEVSSYTNRLTRGINTTIRPLVSLKGSFDHEVEITDSLDSESTTVNRNIRQNDYYKLTYNPFSWFSSHYSYSRNESESPLSDQTGEKEAIEYYGLNKFGLKEPLEYLNIASSSTLGKPFTGSFLTYSKKESDKQENNNLKTTTTQSETRSFNTFTPIKGMTLKKLSYNTYSSLNDNQVQTSTTSQNISQRETSDYGGSLIYIPQNKLLRSFNYSFSFNQRSEETETNVISRVATSTLTTESNPDYDRSQTLKFAPKKTFIPIPYIAKLDMGRVEVSITETYSDQNNQRNEYNISTGDIRSLSSFNRDNILRKSWKYTANTNPLRLFTLNGTYVDSYERLSRNTNATSTGLTFNLVDEATVSGEYSPVKFLDLSGSLTYYDKDYYNGPSLNASLSEMKAAKSSLDAEVFEQFINKKERKASLSSKLKIFKLFTINNGASYSILNEQNITLSQNTYNRFEQITGTAGTTIHPIKGLDITYDYSLRRTEQNYGQATGISREGNTRVTYSPFQTTNVKVNITYDRVDTWGQDLNRLDVSETEQGTGDTIATIIKERNDTVETGSLNLNIEIPLKNSPYVERFVVTGEGYLKKITDRTDDEPGAIKRSYEIAGMQIKGTLFF